MSDAPERIWIDGSEWFDDPPLAGDNQPEYIREDLHTADIRAARREAYAQAMEDVADEFDRREQLAAKHMSEAARSFYGNAATAIRALPNPYEADT